MLQILTASNKFGFKFGEKAIPINIL